MERRRSRRIEEWDEDARVEWCETWAPNCPIGNPQRVATLVGYREREPGRLQLRAVLRGNTEGVCDAIVEEDESTVRVRVLLCWEDGAEHFKDRDYVDCPVHVYLEKPLNGRTVIEVDEEQPLPLARRPSSLSSYRLFGALVKRGQTADPAAAVGETWVTPGRRSGTGCEESSGAPPRPFRPDRQAPSPPDGDSGCQDPQIRPPSAWIRPRPDHAPGACGRPAGVSPAGRPSAGSKSGGLR